MRTERLVELSGATPRQVEFWRTRGYITPSVRNPSGSGKLRDWSDDDVVQVMFMRHLTAMGVVPERAASWWDNTTAKIEIDTEFVSLTVDVRAMREELFTS